MLLATAGGCSRRILVQKQKPRRALRLLGVFYPGNDLVSHKVALAVPSALRGLTSVFGMGTGVTLSVRSPETGWGKSGDRHRILNCKNSVRVPRFPQVLDNSILMGK